MIDVNLAREYKLSVYAVLLQHLENSDYASFLRDAASFAPYEVGGVVSEVIFEYLGSVKKVSDRNMEIIENAPRSLLGFGKAVFESFVNTVTESPGNRKYKERIVNVFANDLEMTEDEFRTACAERVSEVSD